MTIGEKYGLLTIIEILPNKRVASKKGIVRSRKEVICKCSCGKDTKIEISRILSGNTKSCGCFRKKIVGELKSTHGLSKSIEYSIWCKMKDRCYNDKLKDYKWYGGRNIKVCDRWLNNFENFLDDMGKRPSLKHSIDRFPNKDGDYEPTNCRWATLLEQANNKNKKGYLQNISI